MIAVDMVFCLEKLRIIHHSNPVSLTTTRHGLHHRRNRAVLAGARKSRWHRRHMTATVFCGGSTISCIGSGAATGATATACVYSISTTRRMRSNVARWRHASADLRGIRSCISSHSKPIAQHSHNARSSAFVHPFSPRGMDRGGSLSCADLPLIACDGFPSSFAISD